MSLYFKVIHHNFPVTFLIFSEIIFEEKLPFFGSAASCFLSCW